MNFLHLFALHIYCIIYNIDEVLPFVTETPHNLMAAAERKILFAFIFLTRDDE